MANLHKQFILEQSRLSNFGSIPLSLALLLQKFRSLTIQTHALNGRRVLAAPGAGTAKSVRPTKGLCYANLKLSKSDN